LTRLSISVVLSATAVTTGRDIQAPTVEVADSRAIG